MTVSHWRLSIFPGKGVKGPLELSGCRPALLRVIWFFPAYKLHYKKKLSSLQRVFAPLFGRNWRLVLCMAPLVVLWPIIVFWSEISFDPSDFVEEWIKISLATFIFYFLVEVAQERRRSELSRQDTESFCANHLVSPLERAVEIIDAVLVRLKPGAQVDISDDLLVACRHVEHVRGALATLGVMSLEIVCYSHLAGKKPELLKACIGRLVELSRVREWGVVPIADLQAVVQDLKELADALGKKGELGDTQRATN